MNSKTSKSSRTFRPSPLWVLLVLAVAVVGITLYRARSLSSQPETDAPADSAAQADTPAVVATKRTAALRPAAESVEQMEQQVLENKLAVQAEVDETYSGYKTQYDNERTNPQWSAAKEQDLLRLRSTAEIARLNADVSNLQVDCKSSMCRLTGDFPTMTAGSDWFTLYSLNVGEGLPSSTFKFERNADGTSKIVIYAVGRK